MIIISNKPVQGDAISNEYPSRSVERYTVNKISSSNKRFQYDSLEELKFELELRKQIVRASVQLHNSRMSFRVFRESKCNPRYWDRTFQGGFLLKKDAKPSDAINDIYINGQFYGTECATAMVIVYYKALLNVFDDYAFNEQFPAIHLMNWHYIDKKFKEVGNMREVKEHLPGDRRYFINPDVDPLNMQWQGENVIDLNNELYYGHGTGISRENLVIATLNINRREGATQSAYLLDSAGNPNYKSLFNIYYQYVFANSATV